MYDVTETPAERGALHCPSWCSPEHRTDPELADTGHYRAVWEGWLPEVLIARQVRRPDTGSWELFIEQPTDRSRLETVTLEHSPARGDRVAMLPGEARALAAALVRAADLAEGTS
jgi:hypothetical protein